MIGKIVGFAKNMSGYLIAMVGKIVGFAKNVSGYFFDKKLGFYRMSMLVIVMLLVILVFVLVLW